MQQTHSIVMADQSGKSHILGCLILVNLAVLLTISSITLVEYLHCEESSYSRAIDFLVSEGARLNDTLFKYGGSVRNITECQEADTFVLFESGKVVSSCFIQNIMYVYVLDVVSGESVKLDPIDISQIMLFLYNALSDSCFSNSHV